MKRISVNDLPLMEQYRSYRKALSFKQSNLAEGAGTSREAYVRAEGGRANPRLSSLIAWAEWLGCRLVLEPVSMDALTANARIVRSMMGEANVAGPQGEQPTLKECSSTVGLPPVSPTALRVEPLTTSPAPRWPVGDVVTSNTPKTT